MPSFRCMYLDKWLHKGQISQEEYDKAIKKLDGHDAEIKGQIIRDVLETVKEQNEIYLDEHIKQIRAEAIEEVVGNIIESIEEIKKWYENLYNDEDRYDVQICIVLEDLNKLADELKELKKGQKNV